MLLTMHMYEIDGQVCISVNWPEGQRPARDSAERIHAVAKSHFGELQTYFWDEFLDIVPDNIPSERRMRKFAQAISAELLPSHIGN